MVQYEQLIYNANLLKDIEKEQIALYFEKQQFKFITYMKGTVVHLENDSCKNLEIILSGKVVVERLDESGGILTVAEFNENDILGGNLLFSNKPYYPMTITTKQETIILEIAKDVLFVGATGLQVILKFTKNLLRLSLRLTIQSQILYWGI